ncbi:MAG: DUF3160 domain-containing protein [Candidatus Promineifilaceae bacterium]|nr:DUF3160 domain-containing protein [Candidatus Promineifilaceae bacterium]
MLAAAKRWPILWACCLLLAVTLACGLQADPTPSVPTIDSRPQATIGAPATPPPLAGTAVALDPATPGSGPSSANGFAPYVLDAVDVGAVDLNRSPELTQIVNAEALERLTKAERDALSQNGFLVVPTPYAEPVGVYRWAAAEGLPTFLTTDVVLFNVALLTSAAWRHASEALTADLQAMSEALVRASLAQWLAATEEETDEAGALAEAAWRNLAFFSVGGRLLDPDFEVPSPVAEVVAEEQTLIGESGVYISPLFGVRQDYGVYEPDPDRAPPARFQRAAAWYAHPFSFDSEEPAATRRAARQVLLMALALQASENWTRWERVYHPTTFFEGTAGVYDIGDATVALDAVYGVGATLDRILVQDRLDDFIATLRALPPPSGFDLRPSGAFSLLPRPQQPDEPLFRELLFNQVGGYHGDSETIPFTAIDTTVGPVRGLPRALDVAAALGSERAFSRLEAAGDAAYEGYDLQMEMVRRQVAQLDESARTQTLGGGWLYAVQPLLSSSQPAPTFVEEEVWWNKQFNSWYGAWLMLRDPFPVPSDLPATAAETGTEAAYVEAEPLVYARLAALVRQVREGLQGRALLDEVLEQKLQGMERLLSALRLIVEKEVEDEPLTADESLLARQAAERLRALATVVPEEASGPATANPLPRIADVYVDAPSGRVLQAALGEAWPLYILVPGVEQPLLAVGAIFSTYEFKRDGNETLTDDSWREMEERPAPAAWMEALLAP